VYVTQVNSQLEVLNVAMNGFGEEGGIQLFEVLKNQESLTELDISANRLTDKVARVISTIIPYNRHLRTLKVSRQCFISLYTNVYLIRVIEIRISCSSPQLCLLLNAPFLSTVWFFFLVFRIILI
jgi:hypothetical protein